MTDRIGCTWNLRSGNSVHHPLKLLLQKLTVVSLQSSALKLSLCQAEIRAVADAQAGLLLKSGCSCGAITLEFFKKGTRT